MESNQFWNKTFPVLRNKYAITIIIFGIWLMFLDQNSLWSRFSDMKKLNQLKEEKVYYSNKIKEDQRRLKELETDAENLEKFAREQYLMKRKNEDIFVVMQE